MARGSILKRKNASGTVTFSIKYRTLDGTQVKKAIGPGRREAERALAEAIAAVDRGEIRTASRETFGEAADRWLTRKRPLPFRDYEAHLRLRLLPAFGPRKLRQITRAHVEAYLAGLDRSRALSRKTINDSLIPLRQILTRAVRDGVIATNPAANRDRDDPLSLPYERPTMLYLNRDDARAYLDAAPGRYCPLAETLIGAGLRIGEAIALEWRDVSWDAGLLTISRTVKVGGTGTPKGDKARNVIIAGYLLDILRDHRADQAREGRVGPLVFTSPTGRQLDRHNVRRRGHSVTLRGAALPNAVRLHDLRHTAATLWLASGQSIYFVQQQLGHKDIQTTIDLYGHPDQAAHRAAADKAAEWWPERPSEGSRVPLVVPRRPREASGTDSDPVTTECDDAEAAA
ncbi:MAG: phage integrase [Solirubrobacterales bacterium]|nr:phage integrase [Solirubrobacterales bacterium]